MPAEFREPDTNVYDPPLDDEELEKRSETLYSLQRCRMNTALTYELMVSQ